ncbi:histidine phosphatase family protein [Amnibacterium endophyticum]|uniref:Histidine phosphatase family protein n=1 Tax=Amnibacterium endophyticum TaxID=2109337 RepID=A0ABW4LCG4_9MICO
MVARAVHLVRHGEVHNPAGVVYGRLPGFRLSERGEAMAAMTAEGLAPLPVTRLIASPMLRTQQSAQPIADRFGIEIETDERVVEAWNRFEGRSLAWRSLVRSPKDWRLFANPGRPSWGEPFTDVVQRMRPAVMEALRTTPDGDVVIVSHQLPIWMVHRSVARKPLATDPRHRRCALSSVTSFALQGGRLVETGYRDPAAPLLAGAVDRGAT